MPLAPVLCRLFDLLGVKAAGVKRAVNLCRGREPLLEMLCGAAKGRDGGGSGVYGVAANDRY